MGCLFGRNDCFFSVAGVVLSALCVLVSCSSDRGSSPREEPSEENPGPVLPFVGGPLIFTEIDPTNLVYEDHEGSDGGWVEIFNTSSEPVNLRGKYLTNSLDEPALWAFGDVVVPPMGFSLVFLSGKDLKDFVAPSDTSDMIGPGCWSWTDSQAEPVRGYSYAKSLPGQKKICFTENSEQRFGSVMKLGDNLMLGWSSISVFVGTGNSSPDDVLDISAANELLMRAYISKDLKVSFRLTQPDVEDWLGYEIVFTGTGDSSTVYRASLPTGTTFPDLSRIYGTRMSPEAKESREVTVKVFEYIVRNRGHEPHASFKSKKGGGSLYLVDENMAIMDSLRYPEIPAGKSWSLGLLAEGGMVADQVFGFAEPTPL